MKNICMSSDYIPRLFPNSLQWTLCTLPILNSCMKDRCGFLHCCTELVSWEHAACLLSGIKKHPLVGGWVNISSVVILIGATASVRYRDVVRSWEGALWEVPLYSLYSEICSCKLPLVSGPVIILQYDLCITCLCGSLQQWIGRQVKTHVQLSCPYYARVIISSFYWGDVSRSLFLLFSKE